MADRRKFWTTVAFAVICVVTLTPALAIGIPFSLMRLGLAREYGWSFLRIGHKEFSRQIYLVNKNPNHRPILSGPVLAFAGDTLHLRYDIAPDDDSTGTLTVSVRELFGIDHPWSKRFGAQSRDSADVKLGPDHFYVIAVGYTNFRGTATLDWSMN